MFSTFIVEVKQRNTSTEEERGDDEDDLVTLWTTVICEKPWWRGSGVCVCGGGGWGEPGNKSQSVRSRGHADGENAQSDSSSTDG